MNYQNEMLSMTGLISPINQESTYQSIVNIMKNKDQYYKVSKSHYQDNVPPTIDGMLGGLAYVHVPESQWSVQYLQKVIKQNKIEANSCLDVGAGIGRVTEHVLQKIFKNIDTVENNKTYSEAQPPVRTKFVSEAQNFIISESYDLIWIQWVIGHLTDEDLLQMLKNFSKMSKFIVIKDNLCQQNFMFDQTDTNILRNFTLFESIVQQSGFKILQSEIPDTWPKNLYPIYAVLLERIE